MALSKNQIELEQKGKSFLVKIEEMETEIDQFLRDNYVKGQSIRFRLKDSITDVLAEIICRYRHLGWNIYQYSKDDKQYLFFE